MNKHALGEEQPTTSERQTFFRIKNVFLRYENVTNVVLVNICKMLNQCVFYA